METTVSSKGQVVLPAKIREQLGLAEGTKMVVKLKGGEVVMKPVERISSLKGILSGVRKTAKELVRESRLEWERKLKRFGA